MLRLQRMTEFGLLALVTLAAQPSRGEVPSATDSTTALSLAHHSGVPEASMAQVLKLLGRAGLVVSERGVRGGYRLARSPEQISLLDAVESLEGAPALTACVAGTGHCNLEVVCPMSGPLTRVSAHISDSFRDLTIQDLAHPPRPAPPAYHLEVSSQVGDEELVAKNLVREGS